jgi:hypothetical protein
VQSTKRAHMVNEAVDKWCKGFLGLSLATSNANVVVKSVAHLGVAGADA